MSEEGGAVTTKPSASKKKLAIVGGVVAAVVIVIAVAFIVLKVPVPFLTPNVDLKNIKMPENFKYTMKMRFSGGAEGGSMSMTVFSQGIIVTENNVLKAMYSKGAALGLTGENIYYNNTYLTCTKNYCTESKFFTPQVNILFVTYEKNTTKFEKKLFEVLNKLDKKTYYENGLIVVEIPLTVDNLKKLVSIYNESVNLGSGFTVSKEQIKQLEQMNFNGYIKIKLDNSNQLRGVDILISAKNESMNFEAKITLDITPLSKDEALKEISEKYKEAKNKVKSY